MAESIFDVENASKEDLLSLLSEQGIDIRSLAAEAKKIKKGEVVESTDSQKKRSPSAGPKFSLVMNDHNDFAVRRETAKTWQMLVVMTSQGTGFLKDKDGSHPLSEQNVHKFLQGMPQMSIPDSWIGYLDSGIDEARSLVAVLANSEIMEGFKYGCGPRYNHQYHLYNNYKNGYYKDWEYAWNKNKELMKDYKDDQKVFNLLLKCPDFIRGITEKWDMRNARDFLDYYSLSLVSLETNYRTSYVNTYWEVGRPKYYQNFDNIFNPMNVELNYSTWRDYILYDAYRLGFAENMDNFISTWNDTLSMEMSLRGKLKEKYPQNLQCLHDQLSYQCTLKKREVDKEKFEDRVKDCEKFEANVKDYVFIAPKETQDFYEEASQQQNCLASYVQRFTDGDSIIMFMRKKNTPEESLVTIELACDEYGKYFTRQQYQARNQATTYEQKKIIDQWLSKINDKDGEVLC